MPGSECVANSFLVSNEYIDRSFFESKHIILSAQNCKILTEALRGSGRTTLTRLWPKTYIFPFPNSVLFVPTARRDCTGSYAIWDIWEFMPKRLICEGVSGAFGTSGELYVVNNKQVGAQPGREVALDACLLSSQKMCHNVSSVSCGREGRGENKSDIRELTQGAAGPCQASTSHVFRVGQG